MGGEAYTDPRYSVPQTHVFPAKGLMQATGQDQKNFFRMPFKAKLLRFGIIVGASAIKNSSNTGFHLKTYHGATVLATFVPGTLAATIGAWDATGCAPETATIIPRNQIVQPGVAVVGGATTDGIGFFLDYQQVYDEKA